MPTDPAGRTGTETIDVVVPVYNKRPFLRRALGSILDDAEASGVARVTVVDHGSTDGSIEEAVGLCAGRARHLVRPGGTIGALRNAGARDSDGPILSFLDCDCVVPPGYFTRLLQVLAEPGRAATGCRVDYPTDGPWVERVWHAMHRRGASDGFREYLNSGNLAIRRDAFVAVGGFDETLVTGEDAELGQRLNARGFRVWEAAELVVLHLDNPHTLRDFFRKEVWHAQGMLGTFRLWPPHLPALTTGLHLVLLGGGAAWLAVGAGGLAGRALTAAAAALAVPVLAVAYRAITKRRSVPWVPAIVLYETYFLARAVALVQILARSLRPSRREGH